MYQMQMRNALCIVMVVLRLIANLPLIFIVHVQHFLNINYIMHSIIGVNGCLMRYAFSTCVASLGSTFLSFPF